MRSELMVGVSILLGLLSILCALHDMLRQRREYKQKEKKNNVLYLDREDFLFSQREDEQRKDAL